MANYLADKTICCGCGACENACPTKAIKMEYDVEGFIYPTLQSEQCIDCKACASVCPVKVDKIQDTDYLKTYAGYSTQEEVISGCASGGFATVLSKSFIEDGGIVFGVAYTQDCVKAEYVCATKEEELKALMSSKYVQSEKKDVYQAVKAFLKMDKKVLFIGCPCDVAALKLFLKKEYENLYTCELVCMGVTSYRIAEEYKKYAEKKNKSQLVAINTRSKKHGWFVSHLEEQYSNGKKKYTSLYGSYYGYGFQVYNRPSCFQCRYRDTSGVADFRIGDFWGIKDTDEFWNPNGVSCIFVRSQKGVEYMPKLQERGFALYETDYMKATRSNMSSYKNKDEKYVLKREKFAKVFQKKGLIAACNATASFSFRVKRIVPTKLQGGLKKIYHMFVDKK